MYRIPRYTIQLVREATHLAPVKQITSPRDAVELLRPLIGNADREHFVVLLLDTRNKVIGLHIVSIGTLNASTVHPREVFKVTLLVSTAAILLAHNHPSGDPSPSPEDIAITARLKQSGEILGIPVLDHIILGEAHQFISFKEQGYL